MSASLSRMFLRTLFTSLQLVGSGLLSPISALLFTAQESTPQNARSSRQFVSRPYIVGGRAIPFPAQVTRVGFVNNIDKIGTACRTKAGELVYLFPKNKVQ